MCNSEPESTILDTKELKSGRDKLSRFSLTKSSSVSIAQELANYPDLLTHEQFYHFQNCCDNIHVVECESGQTKVMTNHCKRHLLCPTCARRRAIKGAFNLKQKTVQVLSDKPKLRPYFITLTVKNDHDLLRVYNHIRQTWNKVIQIRKDAKRNRASAMDSVFSHFVGGAYSIEITNKGNGWHPHIHMMLLSDRGISKREISAEWHRLSKDSYIVDVQTINKFKADDDSTYFEIMKYAMKFTDMEPVKVVEAYQVLKGKRLVGTFGVFRGVDLEPENLNDQVNLLTDKPIRVLVYKYDYVEKKYILVRTEPYFDTEPEHADLELRNQPTQYFKSLL